MLAKNTHDKYRKYRKNTKCNKIPDLQRKEAKKGPEMSPNIAKIAKLTKIFLATIPDKTTWESFPHHVHFPTQQNYFQNDAFAERKPLAPIQCCFPQTPKDQAFFWIHNNIVFRGRGRGKNRYSSDVQKNAVQVYNFLNNFVQDCSWKHPWQISQDSHRIVLKQMRKVTRMFLLAKNTHDKYRKNIKCNNIEDLESKEAKKGPEMSANIAKIAKVTRIFLAG